MTSGTNEPFQSYLNNDGIDELQPITRKHRVSSLSLSDLNQWQNGLTSISAKSSGSNINKQNSLLKLSRNSSLIRRPHKKIVDHERIASYAFCFDIDGVIVKGPDTIPEAIEALKMLDGHNKYNIKIPSIFVTNGGGRSEKTRAQELTKKLNLPIHEAQVIQGHTPMRDLTSKYSNVLVIGGVGDTCRNVAIEYGFKNVYIPLDILKWNPSVSPYHTLREEELAVAKDYDFSKINIEAILVFADSRNWAVDQQIILELLLSEKGRMGTTSATFTDGPKIYFAHSDFIWATNYKLSRYGMGALQVSIAALYREHTGKELKVIRFGKPQRDTFHYANKVLSNWRKICLDEHIEKLSINDVSELGDFEVVRQKPPIKDFKSVFSSDEESEAEDSDSEPEATKKLEINSKPIIEKKVTIEMEIPPASTVYFVGDTPESDIRFANSHDASWYSILVKTGVYQDGTVPKYKPKHTCENVLEAVKYAIEREHRLELNEWNENCHSSTTNHQNITYSGNNIDDISEQVDNLDIHHESLEVPVVLTEEINKIKNVQV